MISWTIFIVWTIIGPFLFVKINNMNNEKINPLKLNLLVLISGPIIWTLKIVCFVKKTLIFLYKLLSVVINKFCLWFGK